MSELQAGWLLSLLLGARHALEPDHVAAVTTLITTERGRPAALGMLWGVGHALALFLMATMLSLVERQLSSRWADRCELLVAAMLIFLRDRISWARTQLPTWLNRQTSWANTRSSQEQGRALFIPMMKAAGRFGRNTASTKHNPTVARLPH